MIGKYKKIEYTVYISVEIDENEIIGNQKVIYWIFGIIERQSKQAWIFGVLDKKPKKIYFLLLKIIL